jgi:hypothetical protein
MTRAAPPRLPVLILSCLLPEEDAEVVLGDLIEEYALRAPSSSALAVSWWCWSQVSRSAPLLAWAAFRRGRWLGPLAAALAAYVVVQIVEFAGTLAISRLLAGDSFDVTVINFPVGLSAMVLGGYLASRIRRGAAVGLAVTSTVVVLALMTVTSENFPVWYKVGFLVLAPLAALMGGVLTQKHKM